jgi:hypothetical protein
MNGFESARHIRNFEREYQKTLGVSEKESFRPATIIALTGLASASATKRAYGSGMDLLFGETHPTRRVTYGIKGRKCRRG